MTDLLRVVLVEDHQVLREGLKVLLDRDPNFQVIGEASSGFEAVSIIQESRPDLVVLDIGLPGLTGIDVASRAQSIVPNVRILILSMHDDARHVRSALEAGAHGFVLKGAGIDAVKEGLLALARGETYLSPGIRDIADHPDESSVNLTAREREVLKLVAEGHTGREIGGLLHISPKTVEKHRAALMQKIGATSTAALVRYAVKTGVVA